MTKILSLVKEKNLFETKQTMVEYCIDGEKFFLGEEDFTNDIDRSVLKIWRDKNRKDYVDDFQENLRKDFMHVINSVIDQKKNRKFIFVDLDDDSSSSNSPSIENSENMDKFENISENENQSVERVENTHRELENLGMHLIESTTKENEYLSEIIQQGKDNILQLESVSSGENIGEQVETMPEQHIDEKIEQIEQVPEQHIDEKSEQNETVPEQHEQIETALEHSIEKLDQIENVSEQRADEQIETVLPEQYVDEKIEQIENVSEQPEQIEQIENVSEQPEQIEQIENVSEQPEQIQTALEHSNEKLEQIEQIKTVPEVVGVIENVSEIDKMDELDKNVTQSLIIENLDTENIDDLEENAKLEQNENIENRNDLYMNENTVIIHDDDDTVVINDDRKICETEPKENLFPDLSHENRRELVILKSNKIPGRYFVELHDVNGVLDGSRKGPYTEAELENIEKIYFE